MPTPSAKTAAFAIASLALAGILAACGGSKGGTTTLPTKTTPTITWATPSAITYGTMLSGTQLNATASVAGTFSYNPAAGTVPTAGTQTLSVSFTPNDTTDYNTAAGSVQIVVNKAVETIAWSNPAAITYGQALGATQLNATPSVPSSCTYTPAFGTFLTAGTQTLGVACSPTDATDYTGATASVQIVVNKATPTITWPTPASITNTTPLSGTQLNATASTAGSFSYNPTAGTTLPVGTDTLSVTFTPTDTTDYNSATGSVQIVVTLRTITINATVGNQWSANCGYLFTFPVTQTGIVQGDNFYLNPYTPSSFSSTPGSAFTVTMGLTNTGTTNRCSPGAYDMYVSGSDGAVSNHHYVPIVGRWNTWAGYNSTDEVQVDFANQTTCKYKLSDGTQDGSCFQFAGFENAVDGNYIATGGIDNVVATYDLATGKQLAGFQTDGFASTDVSMKNGIVCYTETNTTSLTCFSGTATNGDVNSAYVNAAAGVAPASVAMTTGCNAGSNAASAFVYDEASPSLQRFDLFNSVPNIFGEITVTGNKIGSLPLGGFSPAGAVTNTPARFVVTWDSNCQAVVVAPVATGTNPDGSTAYSMELALVNATAGSMRQLGTYVSSALIPASVIRVAADPAGNAVILAATNESAGTTNLVRVSWTLDGSGNPTFTTTALTSAPAVGVYGVSLGVLPNGKISIGQRQTHSLLANQ